MERNYRGWKGRRYVVFRFDRLLLLLLLLLLCRLLSDDAGVKFALDGEEVVLVLRIVVRDRRRLAIQNSLNRFRSFRIST